MFSKMLHRMCYYKREAVKYYPNLFTIGIFKLQKGKINFTLPINHVKSLAQRRY